MPNTGDAGRPNSFWWDSEFVLVKSREADDGENLGDVTRKSCWSNTRVGTRSVSYLTMPVGSRQEEDNAEVIGDRN